MLLFHTPPEQLFAGTFGCTRLNGIARTKWTSELQFTTAEGCCTVIALQFHIWFTFRSLPMKAPTLEYAAAAAEVLSGGPGASAGPEHAPPPAAAPAQASQAAAGASPAKQSKNRAGDATPGAGTPTKNRPAPAATPSPGRGRGGAA